MLIEKEGPNCPMCGIRAIRLYTFNGQKCCRRCKDNIKDGKPIEKIVRRN
jgi:hypothetical protein